jgi:tetraprenyl-beta-curcumene synthase
MVAAPGTVREATATVAALARYRRVVLPFARRQLTEWREAAALIPDPVLREQAVEALTRKAGNPEATAVFALLAPRRSRRVVLRASVALQVAVDYLDSLGEEPGSDPLGDGLQLHGALAAALDPDAEPGDWYAHHPRREDGGYLDRLIAACRETAVALPSAKRILPLARRAAIRCGEGQSHTHAAAAGSDQNLQRWAVELAAPAGFEWWEVAAGASSSVAAHALLALAASPDATVAQAELVDSTYFPSIGALTVLLDDLVDQAADRESGQHSYLRYYPSPTAAAEGLERIIRQAWGSISRLPGRSSHAAILSGVLAFYLSPPGTDSETRIIRERLLSSSGPVVRSLAKVLARGRKPPGQAGSSPGR